MQILLYIYYFLRSVLLRGPLNTYRLIRDDLIHEKRMGIRTAQIKHSASPINYHYQGASYRVLFRIFEWLKKYYSSFAFTDIGCGKGRVLYLACMNNFSPVTGIELDKDLLDIAAENTDSLPVELVHCDATRHLYPSRQEIYFMFNPFSEEVLRQVIKKILLENKKEFLVVYMNPLHRSVLNEAGLELRHRFKTGLYTEAVVYSGKPLH